MLKITDPSLLNDLPQNNRFIGTLPTLDNSSIIFNGKNNILYCDAVSYTHLDVYKRQIVYIFINCYFLSFVMPLIWLPSFITDYISWTMF